MFNFEFPMNLTIDGGRVTTANNIEELADLAELFKLSEFVTPSGVMVHGDYKAVCESYEMLSGIPGFEAIVKALAYCAPSTAQIGLVKFESYKLELNVVVEISGHISNEEDALNKGHFVSIAWSDDLLW